MTSKIFSISEERKVISDVARVNSNLNLEHLTLWQFSHTMPKGVYIDKYPANLTCVYMCFSPKRIPGEFDKHIQCPAQANPISLVQEKNNFSDELNLNYKVFTNISKDYFEKIDLKKNEMMW
jgi:hypothetical protein